jgi:Peptidase inhibitor I9
MKLSAFFLPIFCILASTSTKLVFGADHLRGSSDAAVDGEGDDYEQVLRRLRPGEKIPESYIVQFDNSITDVKGRAKGLIKKYGGNLDFVYEDTIKGFSVKKLPEVQAEKLKTEEGVKHVEEDQVVTITTQSTPWGITRVTSVDPPATYTGSNVAWVLDTGIDLDHPDLIVNATRCRDFVNEKRVVRCDDANGHGTQ